MEMEKFKQKTTKTNKYKQWLAAVPSRKDAIMVRKEEESIIHSFG